MIKNAIIIEDWELPTCCASCPFFKVQVANGGDQSKVCCRVTKEEFKELKIVSNARSINCPMKEISIYE